MRLRDADLFRDVDLFLTRENSAKGLRAAVVCHVRNQAMSSSIACQVACVAKRHKLRKAQGMSAPRTKRGDVDRELDPVLVRALSRLRDAISEAEVSQPTLAERSGLTQGHISRVLSGGRPEVSFYVLAKIAMAVPVSIDFLLMPAPPPAAFDDRDSVPPSSKTSRSSQAPPSEPKVAQK